jgi:hypothetical protein
MNHTFMLEVALNSQGVRERARVSLANAHYWLIKLVEARSLSTT